MKLTAFWMNQVKNLVKLLKKNNEGFFLFSSIFFFSRFPEKLDRKEEIILEDWSFQAIKSHMMASLFRDDKNSP